MRTEFESRYWDSSLLVVGIDEAGRGPLAGPCIVCGVVFPIGYTNDAINDSKKLSEKKRLELQSIIRRDALEVTIVTVPIETIDSLNIYQATKAAMVQIGEGSMAQAILSDAMEFECSKPLESIIKGDSKSVSIAAASIIAKTYRDQMMVAYDAQFPLYGFAKHKGYGTKQHIDALRRYGPTSIHRKSFHVHTLEQTEFDL